MPRQDRPLMEQAYEQLKRRIITLELPPGQRLDDLKLSDQLNISRTPVREALFRLSAEGLVTARGRSGFVVHTLNLEVVADLFEAHMMLAKAVALLAATRATAQQLKALAKAASDVEAAIDRRDYLGVTSENAALHRLEAEAAHSRTIEAMAAGVIDQEQRLAYLCFGGGRDWAGLDDHFAHVKQHHRALIKSYRARDAAAAEKTATQHVRLFRTRVQAYLATETVDHLTFTHADFLTGTRAPDRRGVHAST